MGVQLDLFKKKKKGKKGPCTAAAALRTMPNSKCECVPAVIACLHCQRASQMCPKLQSLLWRQPRILDRGGTLHSLPLVLPGSFFR